MCVPPLIVRPLLLQRPSITESPLPPVRVETASKEGRVCGQGNQSARATLKTTPVIARAHVSEGHNPDKSDGQLSSTLARRPRLRTSGGVLFLPRQATYMCVEGLITLPALVCLCPWQCVLLTSPPPHGCVWYLNPSVSSEYILMGDERGEGRCWGGRGWGGAYGDVQTK